MIHTSLRNVSYSDGEISYLLEQKNVKNLNLRIHKDGRIFVSASFAVPLEEIDAFVISKAPYIRSAQRQFTQMAQYAPRPKQYVSGETFYILGHGLRLKVNQGPQNKITSDGVFLFLQVKDAADMQAKRRIVTKYLNQQCLEVFHEIITEIYPAFQKYGIAMPILRIRDMDTRWGSCLSKKGIITLNKRLLEMPRDCIEYVVTHEFCHFIHPNHSKQFYEFLNMLMPDWQSRKKRLDLYIVHGL